jgi:hypothetical protein
VLATQVGRWLRNTVALPYVPVTRIPQIASRPTRRISQSMVEPRELDKALANFRKAIA